MIHGSQDIQQKRREVENSRETSGCPAQSGTGSGEAVAEEWRAIRGYEGMYEVSNQANVRSLPRTIMIRGRTPGSLSGKPMRKRLVHGYYSLGLSRNGVVRHFLVSRLVALAFIPEIEGKPNVNHINGIKTDNRIENLEWVTQKENTRHAWRTGLAKPRCGSAGPGAKLTESEVLEIRSLRRKIPNTKLATMFGVSITAIDKIHARTCWKYV